MTTFLFFIFHISIMVFVTERRWHRLVQLQMASTVRQSCRQAWTCSQAYSTQWTRRTSRQPFPTSTRLSKATTPSSPTRPSSLSSTCCSPRSWSTRKHAHLFSLFVYCCSFYYRFNLHVVFKNRTDDINALISGKLALKYTGPQIESIRAIATASQKRSLAEFQLVGVFITFSCFEAGLRVNAIILIIYRLEDFGEVQERTDRRSVRALASWLVVRQPSYAEPDAYYRTFLESADRACCSIDQAS